MARCKRQQDVLELRLEPEEVELFQFLSKEFRKLLEGGDFTNPMLKAFSPSQQRESDPEAEETGLEEDMEEALMAYRLERLESVSEELLEGREDEEGGLVLPLSEERADTWLSWLTDLRLLISAATGKAVHEESLDFEDPDTWTMEERMYVFLSGLQDMMLRQLGG